jgi:hypothetical protein
MDLGFTNQLSSSRDVRHQVRHLGWFRRSFKRCVALVTKDWGIDFTVHDEQLAKAFLDWANAFAEQRKYAELSRKDFANFAAGLLLKELIANKVCAAGDTSGLNLPDNANERVAEIIKFWPEGFLYTSFCLSVLNAVMVQDFDTVIELKPIVQDLGRFLPCRWFPRHLRRKRTQLDTAELRSGPPWHEICCDHASGLGAATRKAG